MLHIIGIPYDSNSSFLKGPALAPPRIRLMEQDGSANAFSEDGIELIKGKNYNDFGDIVFAVRDPQSSYDIINHTIKKALNDDHKIISLGGDHSVSFPVISAFLNQYPDLNILHLDAHADLYDNFENNYFSHASPFARIMETGKVRLLTQVGIRTLNAHQRQQADRFGVKIIEMKNFDFHFLNELAGPLYISLDLDVLDPAFAPGISHHEPGGLSTRQLIQIIQNITVPIVGADIVEYNPVRDINNMTAMVAYRLLKELAAKMIN